ncbi:MAG: excinuclease ABC subunit UvrC [Clostridia bacterium]|nr:excinuclease ABC subunit UvrC [Clostridia bacterium]
MESRIEYLRNKSNNLPRTPGIYIMKDRKGTVIYVGKSRSLKDRVSQYFHLSSDANLKTVRMVSNVYDFEIVLCDTEIEALALENVKIKQYSPKYNILLKDSKSYPYIKVTMNEDYPRLHVTRKRLADGARYYGPYSGMSVVYNIIESIEKSLMLPVCKRSFPKDIGKERPCIYKQLGRCVAPCDNSISQRDYYGIMQCAAKILRGNTKDAIASLTEQMYSHAENERFEDAARCRDTIEAMKHLGEGQKVVGSPDDEYDIIATFSNELSTCISIFYIRSGIIADSETFIFGASELTVGDDYEYMSSFICELYERREYIPTEIFLSFQLAEDERVLIEEYLRLVAKRAINVKIPQKGEHKRLCEMVTLNAEEQSRQYKIKSEHDIGVLTKLAEMLCLEELPERIEAYDISNLGKEHITAGMIVWDDGKLQKKDYRVFKIKNQDGIDDYSAMREVIERRLSHLDDESGSYSKRPDLILLDGGMTHVGAVKEVLDKMSIIIPVFGMVKDEHHKTRTIVTDTEEISIAKEQSVFVFVYKLQEEVHRFTVSKMDSAKRKTMKHSAFESIKGIGPAKAKALLAHFKTVSAIRNATEEELASVRSISQTDAKNIVDFFKK